jgi:hypothetical protein
MWRHDEIDLLNGVHVIAKGRGSQIRGLNVNAQRPDAILLDDVEDREAVQTEEQREKTRKWFYNDVLPALPTGRTDCPVWVLGTLLHSEALLVTIEKDPRFTILKFSTRKRGSSEIGSLWPFVQKQVQLAFYSASQVDQLASYYMEYEGEIRNEATAIFKERYLKWGDPPEGEPVTYAVAMDPAISEKKTADFACVIAIALSLRNGYIYVLKSWGRRGPTPYDLLAKFFEFVKACPDGAYGIEAIAYQASLIHIARTEMFRTGQYFEITPITHSSGPHKVARIKGILQPRYASGMIYHSGRHLELESQLKTFDEKMTSKVDFPDTLAMAVALLDPYAAAAANPEVDLGASEYEPLQLRYAV